MIDYICIEKIYNCKDTPFFGNCEKVAELYRNNASKYTLRGCKDMDVVVVDGCKLIVSGSLPYFWQGHNFTFGMDDFRGVIDILEDTLHFNLWDAHLNTIEYGKIVEVDNKPELIIKNHTCKPQLKQIQNDRFIRRWREGKTNTDLKMYDAGKNLIQKVPISIRNGIEGYDKGQQYLKWEAHYKDPGKAINNGWGLRLDDLLRCDIEEVFRKNLYKNYEYLIPMKQLKQPTTKKDLTTADIVIRYAIEQDINRGIGLSEIKKRLYASMNALPNELLSKEDKKARKRTISALLAKCEDVGVSTWSINEQLKKALKI